MSGFGTGRIVRLVLVAEAETANGGTEAYLVQQVGGSVRAFYQADHMFDGDGNRIPVDGPRPHRIEIRGLGTVEHYPNADDLFGQWRGPQPTPTAGELPAATPELEEGS